MSDDNIIRTTEELLPHWVVEADVNKLDYFGRPTSVVIKNTLDNRRFAYKPKESALLNEKGGKVMCSCCSRQLKRKYLTVGN